MSDQGFVGEVERVRAAAMHSAEQWAKAAGGCHSKDAVRYGDVVRALAEVGEGLEKMRRNLEDAR